MREIAAPTGSVIGTGSGRGPVGADGAAGCEENARSDGAAAVCARSSRPPLRVIARSIMI